MTKSFNGNDTVLPDNSQKRCENEIQQMEPEQETSADNIQQADESDSAGGKIMI